MSPCKRLVAVLVLVLVQACVLAVERFQPGERVVFFGDSITHGGSYVFYAQLYWDLRHPGSKVVLMNGGISGDSAGGAIRRWEDDILPMRPDRAFVMFGMNDVGRGNYASQTPAKEVLARRRRSLSWYEGNQRKLADAIQKAGVNLVMVTPSPYDQYGAKPQARNFVACNDPGLRDCAGIVRKLASERKVGVVDYHAPMTELLKAHPEAMLCGGDRVHPRNVGHLLMAALLLESMEADSAGQVSPVASVWLDVSPGKATVKDSAHAAVEGLTATPRGVSWDYAPSRLPFPALKEVVALEKLYPQAGRSLNQEVLRVTGLASGRYVLKADGREIGRPTAEELGRGLSIALLDTPNQRQAQKAAKVMYRLRALESNLRDVPYMNTVLKGRKVDLKDQNACFKGLDDWLLEQEARKNSALRYFQHVVKNYKRLRPQEETLKQQTLTMREELRQACKPRRCRLSLEKL